MKTLGLAAQRAWESRDPRFDGRLFVGVRTTGIYCRPICPARRPRPENVLFFACAAAAEAEGYRPCLRCRPETAPGSPAWRGTEATVSRALRLIAEGGLDGEDVDSFASKLGVGSRHLRRLFEDHVGASPAKIARSRRVHFARRLLYETSLPLTRVALAAGFSSERRLHAAIRSTYGRPPSSLRRSKAHLGDTLELELTSRAPYDVAFVFGFLAQRAIPGVEHGDATRYRRTFRIAESKGTLEVTSVRNDALRVRISLDDERALLPLVNRVRCLFDLDGDPATVCDHFEKDRFIGPLVRRRPGTRVPGALDPFEMAIRAVLGQQVSVQGARTLLGRLVERCGTLHDVPTSGLERFFPNPAEILAHDLSGLGVTGGRIRTIRDLSTAVASGQLELDMSSDLDKTLEKLRTISGIGPWTAQYIAMRALGDPDAFIEGDLGIAKALERLGSPSGTQSFESWRPFRAYAAVHLWRSLEQDKSDSTRSSA